MCPVVLFCGWGTAEVSRSEGRQPPIPKGWTSRSRRTRHTCRPPGRPCRESPGLFVLSLSHYVESRQTVGCQSTRATPCLIKRPQRQASTEVHKASRPPQRCVLTCLIKRQRCRRVDLLAGGLEACLSKGLQLSPTS